MPSDGQGKYKCHNQVDQMVEAVTPDAKHSRSDVSKGREHPGVQMVEQMAVEGPKAWIIGVEGDHHALLRGHQHRVAHCAGEAFPVDLDDLELVPVQVHR